MDDHAQPLAAHRPKSVEWGLAISLERIVEGIFGPYGAAFLILALAFGFYMKVIVPGSWWKTERAARIRAEARVQQLLLIVGKVTGANEVFLEAIRESQPKADPSETP